jgi:natural product biosynthesis luciferase-like monooxygenase protein/amino acid adenylation domain-containing protein
MSAQSREGVYRLSPVQQGMLYAVISTDRPGVHVQQVVGDLQEALDVEAFHLAVEAVVNRHPTLRARFRWQDLEEPVQEEQPGFAVPLSVRDWRSLGAAEQAARLGEQLSADRRLGLELTRAPLHRLFAARVADAHYRVVWTLSGLLADAASRRELLREVFEVYERVVSGGAVALGDAARPERAPTVAQPAHESYWKQVFADFAGPAPLQLGAASVTDELLREVDVALHLQTRTALKRLAEQSGVGVGACVQAAWSVVLARFSASDDVVYGSYASPAEPHTNGAGPVLDQASRLVPVRVQLDWTSRPADLVAAVAARDAQAHAHGAAGPLPIHRWSGVQPGVALFDSIVAIEEGDDTAALRTLGPQWDARSFRTIDHQDAAVSVHACTRPDLHVTLSCDGARVSAADADRLAAHLALVLRRMADAHTLADLCVLPDDESERVLAELSGADAAAPAQVSVLERVAAHAALTPHSIAVRAGGRTLTYAQLDEQSNQIANALRALNVNGGTRVALYIDRSTDMVAAVLGILKAGAAWLPIDPHYPVERVAYMLRDATPAALVTRAALRDALPANELPVVLLDDGAPVWQQSVEAPGALPGEGAYVIYTSGSTGEPKGVQISRANLAQYVASLGAAVGVTSSDRYLHTASIGFSSSVRQLMLPLAAGAELVIAEPKDIEDPVRLFELVRERGVTIADLVPSYWSNCIRALELLPEHVRAELLANSLRLMLSASEPLPADVPRRWREGLGHGAALINMFGQTETTGIATTYPIADGAWDAAAVIRVGRPLAGTRVYILGPGMQPTPAGVAGEVCIAGSGVGGGYLNRAEQTAERFIADPFGEPGAKMYRTGDRARFLADGTIEFMGRADTQVKVRGFRVEVEEVEAALRRETSIAEAAVVARRDDVGENRLVAYCVTTDGALDAAALRVALRRALPEYMVPSLFVQLERLPRTATNKLDRRALPAPDFTRAIGSDAVAPRTANEELIAELFCDVLQLASVGVFDDFFAVGGHSLAAIRLVSRVRAAFGVDIALDAFFANPTVAGLAAALADMTRAADVPVPVLAVEGADLVTSFAQERLWVLHQMDPASAAYNLSAAIRMRGELNVNALQQSLNELVRRHSALRTVFVERDGSPVQRVQPATRVELPHAALSSAGADAEIQLRAVLETEAARPFDLEHGPLFRALLVAVSASEHVLMLTMHHIVSDGWSRGVLYRELSALYASYSAGHNPTLPELPVQYGAYAQWQREHLTQQLLEPQVAYWTKRLGGALPALDLPTDRPRPPVQSYRGATHHFDISAEVADSLRALSRREGVTPFMTLLSAYQVLLARHANQAEVLVGSPIAGRGRPEVEGLIGFFVNTLVFRADLAANPRFDELLRATRSQALEAYTHQEVPFERVVEALQPARDLSRSPIFQTMFILQNTPDAVLQTPGLELSTLEVDAGGAKFDVTLSITARDGGYRASLEYATDLFDAATMERLGASYLTLLESLSASASARVADLPLVPAAQKALVAQWNRTETAYDESCVHELIAQQAARTPDVAAVIFGGERLSYAELDARSNRLAHHLIGLGVGPDTIVGISIERSIELVVAMLGVMKAGGAYLPLDPTYPAERIAFMLQDAAAPVLITQERLESKLSAGDARVLRIDADWSTIAGRPDSAPDSGVAPANLAYVIYTSGSTGTPKGVMIEHRNVANFFAGMDARIGQEQPGTWLAVTSISFDISVLELFWTLARGYTVVVQPEAERVTVGAASPGAALRGTKRMDFGLFYFASAEDAKPGRDAYRLLIEGAKFADRHGFSSVWTPERHFHAFGGLYPNPSVMSAALAVMTENVKIRAGSVVLPLHDPIRVAEEWSVVDNLSNGRVGFAVASGWHDRDFVFAPDNYADRRDIMMSQIETVKELWRGGSITRRNGAGTDSEIRIMPRPVQPELPIWITAAGGPDTFIRAGKIGANILTHLLGQSIQELESKLAAYRQARAEAGFEGPGEVTLMMHTYVGRTEEEVRAAVWKPFRAYLRTSVDLISKLAQGRGQDIRGAGFSEEDMEALLDHAFERYYKTGALMGTPEHCLDMVDRLRAIGVDEIGCLVDFGIEPDAVLRALEPLAEVVARANVPIESTGDTLPEQIHRYGVTHLQCTPSMAAMLAAGEAERRALRTLKKLMVGGEALPDSLARELTALVPEVHNMYGPTETTIWSATHRVRGDETSVPIGTAIANTELHVLDERMNPVPVGVSGELYIGGAGVVRGYHERAELTAQRFVHVPHVSRGRLYRTGDRVRYGADGALRFMGRLDNQVKLRGHRIELGEIESLLAKHPAVHEAVALVREDNPGDQRLVAYVTMREGQTVTVDELRRLLRARLPEFMVPAHIVSMRALPQTPNLKVDRRALPAPNTGADVASYTAPASELETQIAAVWCDVLNVERVGATDNFFDLGGHSLLTLRVHGRLKNIVDRPVTITDLFRFPTVRSLAEYLGGAAADTGASQQKGADRAEARRQSVARRMQLRQRN